MTASGPVSARSASASGWCGARTPTVAGSPPRSHPEASAPRGRTSVSGPGQQAPTRRSARSSNTATDRAVVDRRDQHRELEVPWALLRLEHAGGRGGVVGARPQPVDGVGREDDQLAATGGEPPRHRADRRATSCRWGSHQSGGRRPDDDAVPPGEVLPHRDRLRTPYVGRPSTPPSAVLSSISTATSPPGREPPERLLEESLVELDPTEHREVGAPPGRPPGSESRASSGRRTAGCDHRVQPAAELGRHRPRGDLPRPP